jgi:hypothetical protein
VPHQPAVALLLQFPVLALAHRVHGFEHLAHDVEAVEDDLVLGLWNEVVAGVDVGLAHVQGDAFDGGQFLLAERVTGGFVVVHDISLGCCMRAAAHEADYLAPSTMALTRSGKYWAPVERSNRPDVWLKL